MARNHNGERGMMMRGIIQSVSWLSGKLRRFSGTGLPGQTIRNREIVQHWGCSTNPPEGCHCIMLKSGNSIVSIAEDFPGSGPELNALGGAACLWSDADHYVLVKQDGSIVVKTDQSVTVESEDIRLGSGVELLIKKMVTQEFLTAYNAHIHPDPVSGFSGVPTVLLVGPAAEAVITQKTRSA